MAKSFIVIVLILAALIVYLFVSAPPPLAEQTRQGATLPIERVFDMVEAENDQVRALWTQEIVGAGKKAGLKFDEDWRERSVEAGPLPALFLRETANSLEKNPIRLSLYLGSDFPINDANRFQGVQLAKFQSIKKNRNPQYFFEEDTQRHTAMYSDIASVEPCVVCHNDHPQTPKSDWRLNDVMGATTWSYPSASVSLDEALKIVAALRKGFEDAYTAYMEKTETFTKRPEINDKWPREGFYLPSPEVFMEEAVRRASPHTLHILISALEELPPPQSTARLTDGMAAQ